MKKFIWSAVLIMAVSFYSVSGFANTQKRGVLLPVSDTSRIVSVASTFEVNILEDNHSQKFILSIINPNAEKLNISIRSENGEGYNGSTMSSNFRKRFDMTEAQDGTYTITVTNGKNTFSRRINLATNTTVTRNISFK